MRLHSLTLHGGGRKLLAQDVEGRSNGGAEILRVDQPLHLGGHRLQLFLLHECITHVAAGV